ncbi:MAG TPA: hypothetical protein VGV87_08345 [Blastocatellia bacterium]|jgi:hypothetical protein|nr:hypothetical protein [Blastocatellia bacterium]
MKSEPTFEVFSSIPWGHRNTDIPLAIEDYPAYAFASPDQMRKVRTPVRIRLGTQGRLHALADASARPATPFILHLDAAGQVLGKTPLSGNDQDSVEVIILDYVVDADTNCYLLEHVRSREANQSNNRLRMINRDGVPGWSRIGPISEEEFDFHELSGSFHRLLMDGNSCLYLPATRHAGAIAEIDRDTGAVARVHTSEKFSDKLFMNERGTVIYILYFTDLNLRGLGLFNLEEGNVATLVGDEELYGWLLYAIGVDASPDVYAWRESCVARISFDGRISPIAEFDNIVVRSNDQAVFLSRLRVDGEKALVVQVNRGSALGGPDSLELRLPQDVSGGHAWELIHVDEQEQYYVYGGEEPARVGTLLVYESDGSLKETISPPVDLLTLESRLANYSFWQVDSLGRVYITVTDASGLRVVRLIPGDSG